LARVPSRISAALSPLTRRWHRQPELMGKALANPRLEVAACTEELLQACHEKTWAEVQESLEKLRRMVEDASSQDKPSSSRQSERSSRPALLGIFAAADFSSIRQIRTSLSHERHSQRQSATNRASQGASLSKKVSFEEKSSSTKWAGKWGGSLSAMKAAGLIAVPKQPSRMAMAVEEAVAAVVPLDISAINRYVPATSCIKGFLIDLDGTLYQPGGLLPGAKEFYAWLRRTEMPFVLLSNTGAKNSLAVQRKLSSRPYTIDSQPVPLERIHTACEAQADYLLDHVPAGARILVLSSTSVWLDDLRTRRGAEGARLVATWTICTTISEEQAKDWAVVAAADEAAVWVALFCDGCIESVRCPTTGCEGFDDWGFSVIYCASLLISHGAQLVYTASDAFNPSSDPRYPDKIFPLPGPGMFAAMLLKLMWPRRRHAAHCAGKGGNVGTEYMMERGISMLRDQGHSGNLNEILMVGDRFDTDVRGGLSVGIHTCLVLTGCHSLDDQEFYRADQASYFSDSVGALVLADQLADQHAAAIKLQAVLRGQLHRRSVARVADQHATAIKLQAVLRGQLHRRSVAREALRGDAERASRSKN